MACANFLEVPDTKSTPSLLEELDLQDFDINVLLKDFKSITPIPGFCVKSKTDNNEKLFINVCHSSDIPPPPPTMDFFKIITGGGSDDDDVSLFDFPLSLGENHPEKDKSGKLCKCFDVVINSEYYQEICKKDELRDFLTTIACSGLERKYDISIDIGACVTLKKSYHGTMGKHYIRLKFDSGVEFGEFDDDAPENDDNDIVMPVKNLSRLTISPDPEILQFKLFQVPSEGYPTMIVFQGIVKAVADRKIRVCVSKRTLALRNPESQILLKVTLPFDVIPEMSLSNIRQNRLMVCMTVTDP